MLALDGFNSPGGLVTHEIQLFLLSLAPISNEKFIPRIVFYGAKVIPVCNGLYISMTSMALVVLLVVSILIFVYTLKTKHKNQVTKPESLRYCAYFATRYEQWNLLIIR